MDIAAIRFASAIVNKTDIAIPELGQVIQAEVPIEARRGVNNSLYFRLGGISPIEKNYDSGEGVLFSVGAWSETKGFAIEKTFGIRKSTAHPNDYNSFWEYNQQVVLKIFLLKILSILSNWIINNWKCTMEQVCHHKFSPKLTTCFPVIDSP